MINVAKNNTTFIEDNIGFRNFFYLVNNKDNKKYVNIQQMLKEAVDNEKKLKEKMESMKPMIEDPSKDTKAILMKHRKSITP